MLNELANGPDGIDDGRSGGVRRAEVTRGRAQRGAPSGDEEERNQS
jgi:hypothetical protein